MTKLTSSSFSELKSQLQKGKRLSCSSKTYRVSSFWSSPVKSKNKRLPIVVGALPGPRESQFPSLAPRRTRPLWTKVLPNIWHSPQAVPTMLFMLLKLVRLRMLNNRRSKSACNGLLKMSRRATPFRLSVPLSRVK